MSPGEAPAIEASTLSLPPTFGLSTATQSPVHVPSAEDFELDEEPSPGAWEPHDVEVIAMSASEEKMVVFMMALTAP
jgi:hypothetical protein